MLQRHKFHPFHISHIIGPFFINVASNGQRYAKCLTDRLPELLEEIFDVFNVVAKIQCLSEKFFLQEFKVLFFNRVLTYMLISDGDSE
ncbi:hypothetical protein WH47_08040 [Habropoda laboriosa]|uniref:Uncharacterized protein n=1 Tax=Habropoda laboriosa TaxID=597456 RepID=A0A0L7RFK0_9HYME|nr:hypothetical protein WH47_08040 [Habropoda laboriosa]